MPEEYQKADRLVYCNLVEYLLLQMKILEKELTRIVPERRVGNVVSVKDFALIAKILMTYVIDLFTSPKSEGNPNYGLGWWREADHRRAGYFGSVATSGTFGHQGFTETLTMTMRSDRSIRQVSPMMTIRRYGPITHCCISAIENGRIKIYNYQGRHEYRMADP